MTEISCTYCEDELEGDEIISPYIDKDGDILCDECYKNKFECYCPVCQDFFYKDMDAEIYPKYLLISECVSEYVGVDAGIYEIIKYPFFADGITELSIFKGAVKRICDVPPKTEVDYNTMYYVCDQCVTKLRCEP